MISALAAMAALAAVWVSAPSAQGLGKLGPGDRVCYAVAGQPGDAAVVNLTPVEAGGAGNGQLVSSAETNPPSASNVNFGPATVDPNVAVATIGADGKVCFVNSHHTSVHLVTDHLGTLAGAAFEPATPSGAPFRLGDTRGSAKVGPGERVCYAVAGQPGDAVLVNLTPVAADGPGNGQLVSSAVTAPSTASNVNFTVGTVDPNVAIAPIGPDGQVCYANSVHTSVHIIADHLGTVRATAFQLATSGGAPQRVGDTRGGLKVPPSGRVCYAVAGVPGDAAIVNLTPVEAEGAGNGQLVSSALLAPSVASNVNFQPGSADPNVAIAPIGPDGKVCLVNSWHTPVHVIADHLGSVSAEQFDPPTPAGAPARIADTRTELPPPAPTTTTPPQPIVGGICHPSYPTVCIPPAPPDLDCGDISARRFTVIGSDPHRFDGDNDGIGCESG